MGGGGIKNKTRVRYPEVGEGGSHKREQSQARKGKEKGKVEKVTSDVRTLKGPLKSLRGGQDAGHPLGRNEGKKGENKEENAAPGENQGGTPEKRKWVYHNSQKDRSDEGK